MSLTSYKLDVTHNLLLLGIVIITIPGDVKMLLEAVEAILIDEGFQIPSQKAFDLLGVE